MSVSPCKYPGCKDIDGNPELTETQFCVRCQTRLQRMLERLYESYGHLKTGLPRPMVTTTAARGAPVKGYGHPREWASSLAQDIARISATYTAALLKHLYGHEVRTAFGWPIADVLRLEESRLMHGCTIIWKQHWDQLIEWDQCPDMVEELSRLQSQAKFGLGEVRMVRRLIAPCPKCDVRALTTALASQTVECASCGHRFASDRLAQHNETQLARQQRFNFNTIDRLLEDYDATAQPSDQSPEHGR